MRGAIFSLLAIGGFGLDLLTKEWVFQWRGLPRPGNEHWLVENFFGLQIGIETSVNHGALFGLGQGFTSLFVGLSFVAVLGIVVWLFVLKAAEDWVLTLALGVVLGGILGNLYDRLGLWNAPPELACGVRDWILFRFQGHTWPNFNIADSLLVCGAAWLMWHSLWQPGPDGGNRQKSPSKATR